MTMISSGKTVLHIDIETYCELELKQVGVHKYAEHESFELLLIGYAFDDEETQIIDVANGEEVPEWFKRAIVNPEATKAAHNANFERTCLQRALGVTLPPEQWYCSAVRASSLGLPRSLEELGKVLGITGDKAKMREGRALVRFFCMPCKPTKKNGERTRNLPKHEPEQWAILKRYCGRDVDAERESDKLMSRYPETTKDEHALWCLDQRINEKGVLIETKLVRNILTYNATHTDDLLDRARVISGLANPKSINQSKEWLAGQGIETTSLTKDTVKQLIKDTDDDDIQEFLEIRQQLGKTSVAKYDAIARAINHDKRVRGILQFYGAERTGRWAGRIIQPQNLPRNKMRTLELARNLIIENDFELLELLYPSVMQVFSELIRTAIIAPKGHTFIVADYSAIEARVIAWLAHEKWRLDVFAGHGKIYEASAAQMFKVSLDTITKDSPERAKGKVAELALGYQGSVGALQAMGASEIGLTESEMRALVTKWRAANQNIVKFWYTTEENATEAIMNPGRVVYGPRGVEFKMIHDSLFIKLPSGRSLGYKNARIIKGTHKPEIVYDGKDQNTGRWCTVKTYGGKLVENITQAIARDCLGTALIALWDKGYLASFHVHDEVIIEVPIENKGTAMDEITTIMNIKAPWSTDLIVTAEAFDTTYYMKE